MKEQELISILVKPPRTDDLSLDSSPLGITNIGLIILCRPEISLNELELPTPSHELESSDGSALPLSGPSLRRPLSSSSDKEDCIIGSNPDQTIELKGCRRQYQARYYTHLLPTLISHRLPL